MIHCSLFMHADMLWPWHRELVLLTTFSGRPSSAEGNQMLSSHDPLLRQGTACPPYYATSPTLRPFSLYSRMAKALF